MKFLKKEDMALFVNFSKIRNRKIIKIFQTIPLLFLVAFQSVFAGAEEENDVTAGIFFWDLSPGDIFHYEVMDFDLVLVPNIVSSMRLHVSINVLKKDENHLVLNFKIHDAFAERVIGTRSHNYYLESLLAGIEVNYKTNYIGGFISIEGEDAFQNKLSAKIKAVNNSPCQADCGQFYSILSKDDEFVDAANIYKNLITSYIQQLHNIYGHTYIADGDAYEFPLSEEETGHSYPIVARFYATKEDAILSGEFTLSYDISAVEEYDLEQRYRQSYISDFILDYETGSPEFVLNILELEEKSQLGNKIEYVTTRFEKFDEKYIKERFNLRRKDQRYLCYMGRSHPEKKAIKYCKSEAKKGDVYSGTVLADMYNNSKSHFYNPKKAIKLYRKQAKGGNKYSQQRLGSLYKEGSEALPKNKKEAVKWLMLSSSQDYTFATYKLAKFLLEDESSEQYEKGLDYLRLAAIQGNRRALKLYAETCVQKHENRAYDWQQPETCFEIIQMHADADNSEKLTITLLNKYSESLESPTGFLLSAVVKENKYATYLMGKYYIRQDDSETVDKGVDLLKKAYELKLYAAARVLGDFARQERQPEKSIEQAIFWYEKSIEHGDGVAAFRLASTFEYDLKDSLNAFRYYKLAYELGHEYSGVYYAKYLSNENFKYRDEDKSFGIYKKLSEKYGWNEVVAELAWAYYYGLGTKKDYERAYYWYSRVNYKMEQRNAFSWSMLGYFYAYGYGTEKNLDKAKTLLEKSLSFGETDYVIKDYVNVLFEKKEFKLALPWVKKMIDQGYRLEKNISNLSKIYYKTQQFKLLRETLNKIESKFEISPEQIFYKAELVSRGLLPLKQKESLTKLYLEAYQKNVDEAAHFLRGEAGACDGLSLNLGRANTIIDYLFDDKNEKISNKLKFYLRERQQDIFELGVNERELIKDYRHVGMLERYDPVSGQWYLGETVSISFMAISLENLMLILSDFSGYPINLSENIDESQSLFIRTKNYPWDKTLALVAEKTNLDFSCEDNEYYLSLSTKNKFRNNMLIANGNFQYEGKKNRKGDPHGYGVMEWESGVRYEGDLKNGSFHGQGQLVVMNESSSTKYLGQWKEGRLVGRGVYVERYDNLYYGRKSITYYEGDFKENLYHGFGKLDMPGYDYKYHGNLANGVRDGTGVLCDYKTGESYCAVFKRDRLVNKHRCEEAKELRCEKLEDP